MWVWELFLYGHTLSPRGQWLKTIHYGDGKWPSWSLELPVNQVFVQTDNKETSCVRNPQVTGGFPLMFPFDDVIILFPLELSAPNIEISSYKKHYI